MENILWAGVQVLVPDLDEAVGLMGRRGVLGVRGQNEFREL